MCSLYTGVVVLRDSHGGLTRQDKRKTSGGRGGGGDGGGGGSYSLNLVQATKTRFRFLKVGGEEKKPAGLFLEQAAPLVVCVCLFAFHQFLAPSYAFRDMWAHPKM